LARLSPVVAASLLLVAPAARADGLSAGETARLLRGEPVSRPQQLDRGSHHYVGGVTYEVIDAAPGQVTALMDDVKSWRRLLPRTREATPVGEADGDSLVELTHGSSLVQVSYTLRLHRDGTSMRFWMDRGRSHDIDDAWGYARSIALPDGRTLLTWGILVDMGPGLLRELFESRVQTLALAVPDRVRDVMLERSARGQRASR
jgi:hypothetical protein